MERSDDEPELDVVRGYISSPCSPSLQFLLHHFRLTCLSPHSVTRLLSFISALTIMCSTDKSTHRIWPDEDLEMLLQWLEANKQRARKLKVPKLCQEIEAGVDSA